MVLRSSKKAQEGEGTKAATLVAIIGGLIILYILFIPPSEREDILNLTNDTNGADENGGASDEEIPDETLLLEHPGLLEHVSATEFEKSIPPTTLFVSTEAATLKTAESIDVKNNWFSNQAYNLTFSLSNVENTKNVIFSVNIDDKTGELTMELNGQKIYEKEPETSNLAINLPSDLLSERNSLLIKSDSVGFAFWKTNSYSLSNLKLVADITDVSGKKAQSSFIISSTEHNNLEKARLRFYVDCDEKADLGKLNVDINNNNIYSKIPICGDLISKPVSTNILSSGENTITFSTEVKKPSEAYYLIDNILIRLSLKEQIPFTYYFDLNSTQFEAVKSDDKNLTLNMLFTDSVSRKRADLFINGIQTGVETREKDYERKINSFAKEGNNAVKIDPTSTFEIVDLIVELD